VHEVRPGPLRESRENGPGEDPGQCLEQGSPGLLPGSGAQSPSGGARRQEAAAVSKDKKILVIEQCIPYSFLGKDLYSHPHMFCEQMSKHSTNLILDDTAFHSSDEEVEEALKLAKEADLVVMTNYYARIEKRGNNQHLVKALKAADTP
jgi:hypothetical protein